MRRRLLLLALLVVVAGAACAARQYGRFRSVPADAACLAAFDEARALPREVRRCADRFPARVIAFGEGRAATDEELQRIQDAHARGWFAFSGDTRGLMTVGQGGACAPVAGAPRVPAITLSYTICTFDEAALIERIAADVAGVVGDGVRVEFALERSGVSRRERVTRRHAGVPVHERHPELGGLSGGACGDDGDCVVAGCGSNCVPWNEPGFIATCEGYTALEGAACGCYESVCTWLK